MQICHSPLAKLAALFLGAISVSAELPAAQDIWAESTAAPLPARANSGVSPAPAPHRRLALDRSSLEAILRTAPPDPSKSQRGVEIWLPLPAGGFARFLVWDSPIMAAGLSARFPELRTYSVQGIDDPTATGRLDLTPRGFSAVIFSARGQFLIDPAGDSVPSQHVVYYRRNLGRPHAPLPCEMREPKFDPSKLLVQAPPPSRPTGANLRVFRLALAATAEYSAAASGTPTGSVASALAAIVTSINRVNALLERDLAIRLVLVAGTDQLIYTNVATQPYSNANPILLPGQNQANLDSQIGSANYDVGHVLGTVAGDFTTLASVCQAGSKAEGATGLTNPAGDPFDIDALAHSLGHQFGAHHSFNGNGGLCAGANRHAANAFEVGSGSTVMAFAGQCSDPSPAASQDLAAQSDAYFHSGSYDEIDAFVSALSCAQSFPTGNAIPVIAPLPNFVIPAQTPFALTASASDANGDALTYCWEEMDLGPEQDPTADPRDNGSSPLFRSFPPSPNPTRLFPSLGYILNSLNLPPATVGGFATGETLPLTARSMNFRVTVRDNRAGGGGSDYRAMTVTSIATAGPFALTNFSSNTTLAAGSLQHVDWNVAGTDVAPINCASVRISLSTDGGNTFPYVLASGVPNNGTALVTIPASPSVATRQARFKVEAAGNIFFDISKADLVITSANAAPLLNVTGSISVLRGTPTATTAAVATATDPNGDNFGVSASNVPAGLSVMPSLQAGTISLGVIAACDVVTSVGGRDYPLTLTLTDSNGATTSGVVLVTVLPNPAPSLGDYADISVPTIGATVTNAPATPPDDANANLISAPVSVSPLTLPGAGTIAVDANTGVVTIASTAASTPGITPVRVTISDACGAVTIRSFNVRVVAPVPVLQAGTPGTPGSENCVPPNGAIDPGETVTISLPIANIGGAPTTNLAATLQTSGGVTALGSPTRTYGAIPYNGMRAQTFTFLANGACGGTITATLQLQDSAMNFGAVAFVLRLGADQQTTNTLEHFDGINPPALPTGWSTTVVAGFIDPWVTAAVGADSAPNAALAIPVSSSAEVVLDTPAFSAGAGTNQLRFRQRWNTEFGFDGGVLEISLNGGAFTDVITAGGSFVSGGYSGALSGGSVLAGRQAWTGSSGPDYRTTLVTLPPNASGQSVRLRFRLACDDSGAPADPYWRIDTLDLLSSLYVCTSCNLAPVFTSAPPASPVTVGTPYFHAFTASGSPTPVFGLTAGSFPPGLVLGTTGLLSGTPTGAGTGSFPNITVTASNGVAPSASQTFSLGARTVAANYLAGFGLTGGNAALTADPNGDGVPNLLAYALGFDPTVISTNSLPRVAIKNYAGTPYAMMTFQRSSVATDLIYLVEASADLNAWTTIATSSAGAATSGPGFVAETGVVPTFTVEVRDVVPANPANGLHRFLRLRVTTP